MFDLYGSCTCLLTCPGVAFADVASAATAFVLPQFEYVSSASPCLVTHGQLNPESSWSPAPLSAKSVTKMCGAHRENDQSPSPSLECAVWLFCWTALGIWTPERSSQTQSIFVRTRSPLASDVAPVIWSGTIIWFRNNHRA
jgi:hypothetical protein